MGLSAKRVRLRIDEVSRENKWKPVSYRSAKEQRAKIDPPLTAFETTWTLTEEIKPGLKPEQKRRPKGSIKKVKMQVRALFYRHQYRAEKETEKRKLDQEQLEKALLDFTTKLNKRQYLKNLDVAKESFLNCSNPFQTSRSLCNAGFLKQTKGSPQRAVIKRSVCFIKPVAWYN